MTSPRPPLAIRLHAADNVAIVANDGGLPSGTQLPDGLALRDKVPQGHKVALTDIEEFQTPHIEAKGSTALGEALTLVLDCLRANRVGDDLLFNTLHRGKFVFVKR